MSLRTRSSLASRIGAALALGAMLGTLVFVVARAAWIGTGFYAKQLCSEVFVAGRDQQHVVAQDLQIFQPAALFRTVGWQLDSAGRVTADWLGLVRREAHYLGRRGCVLRSGEARTAYAPGEAAPAATPAVRQPLDYSTAGWVGTHRWDTPLQRVVNEAFDEPDPERNRRTRAVLVLRHGRIAAERYAPGFDARTRFCGWSMTKSVVNALVGALAQQGQLHVQDRVQIAAWSGQRDPRASLTYEHLLHMSSGLAFDERYDDPFSDVTTMLFGTGDTASYAAAMPLVASPNTRFAYGSGTTNLISRALRHVRLPGIAYEDLPRRLLFDRLGMRSALIEMDESGTFVGSSYMYATARDWARFGALFAADGVWNGKRVLPAGWVAYSATPAPADHAARYGAHFWLYDAQEREQAARVSRVTIPADAFFAGGFGGQRITIIPSRGVVIVRLGYTLEADAWNNAAFVARVLATLEPLES